MPDKCPKCGAELRSPNAPHRGWTCGSCVPAAFSQSKHCRIRELEDQLAAANAEIERLKDGRFTPDEFQHLCHNLDKQPLLTCQDFFDGCHHYQRRLFGVSDRDKCQAEIEQLITERDALLDAC